MISTGCKSLTLGLLLDSQNEAKSRFLLAIPAGFEPATYGLEGLISHNLPLRKSQSNRILPKDLNRLHAFENPTQSGSIPLIARSKGANVVHSRNRPLRLFSFWGDG